MAPTEATNTYNISDEKSTELLRLKQELLAANSKIASQEQELAQTRVINHTLDQALGPPSEADFGGRDVTDQTISHLQSAFNASNPAFGQFQDTWSPQDDAQSDISDPLSNTAYNRARGIWSQLSPPVLNAQGSELMFEKSYGEAQHGANHPGQLPAQTWNGSTAFSFYTPGTISSQPGSSGNLHGFCSRPQGEQPRYAQTSMQIQNPVPHRYFAQTNQTGALFPPPTNSWSSSFTSESTGEQTPKSPTSSSARSSSVIPPVGLMQLAYHARQVGTTLSPTATEFTTSSSEMVPWSIPPVSAMLLVLQIGEIVRD